MSHRRFHPQRLYPRYSGLMERASRIPGGLEAMTALGTRIMFDPQVAYSEDPKPADLRAMKIAVVGFPRTGTTFMQNAVNLAYGDHAACWKNHDVLAIPVFVAAGHPVLIPLRDPRDVIVSWMVYNHDPADPRTAIRRLESFIAWHRVARRATHDPHVDLVEFSTFSRAPSVTLSAVASRWGLPAPPSSLEAGTVATDLDHSSGESVVSLEQKHLPSVERNALKPPYVQALADRDVQPVLIRAMSLMDEMRHDALWA